MSQVILRTIDGHDLRKLIESNVYVGKFEQRYIRVTSSRLDSPAEFVYLGFTKAGNPKFGEIVSSGPHGIKIQKRIGKFDGESLSIMGDRFVKSIGEMKEEAYQY